METRGPPPGVIEDISPRDTMFRDRRRYLNAGRRGLECIRVALAAAGKDRVDSVLDLPSGHGRVLRWIRAEFPHARLGACDLDRDGVDFCAATFGAVPIEAHEDPGRVEVDAPYDLIWSGSLFTHLPPERWDGFLDLFERALNPEGVVVFTTHGRRVAELMRDPERRKAYEPADLEALLGAYERDGAGYARYRLDPERRAALSLPPDYGVSLSLPSAVCRALERRPGLRLVCFTEAGFNPQDAVAAVRAPRGAAARPGSNAR